MKLEELFESDPKTPANKDFMQGADALTDKKGAEPSTKRKGQRAQRRLRNQHGRGNESKNAKSYQEQDRY